jgi:hypothetical protein
MNVMMGIVIDRQYYQTPRAFIIQRVGGVH